MGQLHLPRGGDLSTVWKYTYNAFWGTEDLVATFDDMWRQVETNKKVAVLLPNDALGIPWLRVPSRAAGGRLDTLFSDLYTVGSEDFSAEIGAYKKFGVRSCSPRATRGTTPRSGSRACSKASIRSWGLPRWRSPSRKEPRRWATWL